MSQLRKSGAGHLAMPAMVILVGLAAFGLGRLSVPSTSTSSRDSASRGSGQAAPIPHTYVGSKSGSVYYLPSCKGATSIKEENKVWFVSASEAEAAGYKPAANCAGL